MALKDINLNEKQQAELKDSLDNWKLNEKRIMEAQLTEKYEQMEAELKEEYEDLKEEYEDLVEEIKENMKKVYTKRFTTAIKEIYEEIKAQVMVESLNSPERKALEEVKSTVYPLINEATIKRHRNEFEKLASMYTENLDELEILKGANKKGQLMESLSPDVRKVVDKLIGEGTEEEIVEKFAAIKTALKEEVVTTPTMEEEIDYSKFSSKREVIVESDLNEENEIEDLPESRSRKPKVNNDFENLLSEQLILAGVKKK